MPLNPRPPVTGTIYYSDVEGVTVSSESLVVPGKNQENSPVVYAITDIASVRVLKQKPTRLVGFITIFCGAVAIIAYFKTNVLSLIISGSVIVLAGIIAALFPRATYSLVIALPSGDAEVLNANNRSRLAFIAHAINKAIAKAKG